MTSEGMMHEGLTSEEAARRLISDGPNALDPLEKESIWKILLTQMRSVLFLVTSVAGLLYFALGEIPKGLGMFGMVCGVILLNTYGEYTGQDAGAALATMDRGKARAVRDGVEVDVDPKDIVVGDVLVLKMGDMVPADLVVMECVDFQTNEAVLTGEPHEITKTVVPPKDTFDAFPRNMIFKMTSIVAGSGKCEVVATGMRTQVGLIAKRLQNDKQTELSPIQQSLNNIGFIIVYIVSCTGFIITVLEIATGYEDPYKPCGEHSMACRITAASLRGVMVLVALIPHGLPFAVTVMLNLSMFEMGKRDAVVTKSTAVDYLSATSVICTDKTGTLTEGRMTAQALVGLCRDGKAPDNTASTKRSELSFYPVHGLSPNGGLFSRDRLGASAMARIDARYDASQATQVFSEPGLPDLTDRPISEVAALAGSLDALMAQAHLVCGYLNCHGTSLSFDSSSSAWISDGNMTEAAVKVASAKGGFRDGESTADLLKTTHPRMPDLEVPFNSKRKMMATVHRLPESRRLESLQFAPECSHVAVLKGAPDKIIPTLSQVLSKKGDFLVVSGEALSEDDRCELEGINHEFGSKALRSLMVALRSLNLAEVEQLQKAQDADKRLAIIKGAPLTFLSLWGIHDPPRTAVPPSVKMCHEAGIRVVMITGDHPHTATAIAQQVGILNERDPDPDRSVANCIQLHASSTPVISRAQMSRCSAKVQSSIIATNTARRLSVEGLLGANAGRPSTRSRRRTSVHDERGSTDEHEPVYKSMDDLIDLTSRINVWARAQATDKVAIVESLTKQGFITAMTGDGVNDAPALKRASVGVSMGITGTEVTKSAADLVLMDDDFSTIVVSIREGRRIYTNTQKYILCNMSLKFGEAFMILVAICLYLPIPFTVMQQMVNMPLTHSCCTMPFAWEAEEDYIMKVPPRNVGGDLIVPKTMWIWRSMPFIFNFTIVVLINSFISVKAHTGFGFVSALISTSEPGVVPLQYACEHAGVLKDGEFVQDAHPFHCTCNRRAGGLVWGELSEIDQWGTLDEGELDFSEDAFDFWTGLPRNGRLDKKATPFAAGDLVYTCEDNNKVEHNCWHDQNALAKRPLLPHSELYGGLDCASYGYRQGQTMAYVTVQVAEIFSVLTYRRDDCCLWHLHTNKMYLLALFGNLSALMLFIYSPIAQRILGFAPLHFSKFAFSSSLAMIVVFLNEVAKAAYRSVLSTQNRRLRNVALRQGTGARSTVSVGGEQELAVLASRSSPLLSL